MVFTTSEGVGIGVAFVLIVLVRVLRPAYYRGPTAFLALYLLARALVPLLETGSSGEQAAELAAQFFLLASIGRSGVVLVLDVGINPRLARPLPRIIRDILQSVVYVVLLLVALRGGGVEPGQLLTTSALLTAAIALSLQETLGNLVAGLAIQLQRPFDVDDWIQFDGELKHIGRVLEINWRATKVITLDDVEIIVPNATLAKAPITNFTKPTIVSRRSLYVQVPASVDPARVREAVMSSLPNADGVVETPAPSVVLNQFVDGNCEYWIRFHTDGFHRRDMIDSTARERVWYGLARAGISIAAPNRAVNLEEVSHEKTVEAAVVERDKALGAVDFLRVLSPQQRRALAERSRIHRYGAGESVVAQGEVSAEMFIIEVGEVVVSRDGADIAHLGPGDFFGEMALMTGEQRSATVRAVGPAVLIGIEQPAMKALLDGSPELVDVISRAIAERQATAPRRRSSPEIAVPVSVEDRTSQLLARIRRFFSL